MNTMTEHNLDLCAGMATQVVNTSGLSPRGRAVLVKPYKVAATIGNAGIILPEEVRKKDQLAEQRAVVIEAGPEAWATERQPRANPGDAVLFSKWAGYSAIGPGDGGEYRIVNDSDIFTVITVKEAHDA